MSETNVSPIFLVIRLSRDTISHDPAAGLMSDDRHVIMSSIKANYTIRNSGRHKGKYHIIELMVGILLLYTKNTPYRALVTWRES